MEKELLRLNKMREELSRESACAEQRIEEINRDPWRLFYHLMPPVGWMNDPNGLCQIDGVYHVFFQYSPTDAKGGFKVWGHYTSTDLLSFKYEGITFYPDESFDKDGVYSGSTFVENGTMHIFYTGNVKKDGDYDYIYQGRGAATVHVTSEDGIHFSEKEVVITDEEYPDGYSCHIRDPKVWKEQDQYYMVLGARTAKDEGRVLVYTSGDLEKWSLLREVSASERHGFMWECPDYMEVGSKKLLSLCPQGMTRGKLVNQNVYQSGYFTMDGAITGTGGVSDFTEWDYGFDFYAPQSFVDEQGRRIFVGWMGLPDIEEEYQNPTVEKGWQHCLTMFREITEQDGRICQYPLAEYQKLRRQDVTVQPGDTEVAADSLEIQLENPENADWNLVLENGMHLTYGAEQGLFELRFMDGNLGAGRTIRRVELDQCRSAAIYVDTSAVEIYLNGGEKVLSTRYYKGSSRCGRTSITTDQSKVQWRAWTLDKMTVSYQ